MGTINVNRNVSDKFYRYKMPSLIAKVEGKGNGIKTVIVNMTEIARCLSRPPTYLTKFFGCEFGAQTKCDNKNDRFIVNGSHEGVKLQEALDIFIKKFVLCTECNNPETELHISAKKQSITISCKACGYVGNIDPNHKLSAFILKNPIEDVSQEDGKKSKNGKKGKKIDSTETQKNGQGAKENNEVVPSMEEVIPNFGGLVLTEAENCKNTNKALNSNELTELNQPFEDDWNEDGVEARAGDNCSNSQQDRIDKFYHFIRDLKSSGDLDNPGVDKKILAEAENLEIKDKAPMILAELLLDQNSLTQIPKYRLIFLRFCHECPKAQKYLLGAFEQLVGKEYRSELMTKVPHLLKAFYDADLLEEAVIVEWENKVSKKYVDKEIATEIRKRAAPFVKWLKEAESEESSGTESEDAKDFSDSEENEKEEESHLREKHVKRGALLSNNTKTSNHDKGHDSDIDIDAI
ncbi:unnamed protein product [Gordionus sp. m RMFG-2023]|uniref:eukaryotic translation initiation factor 5-like n=1 Tax=Gordionus sp. m RMFG-2023 TaxID=3053472 RepID=UPI0030DE1114